MSKPTKAVVVFSGGQDSTTCLFWAKKKYEEVIALSFDYGQKHSDELICAKESYSGYGPLKPAGAQLIDEGRY